MARWRDILRTIALLVVVSLPTVLFVVVSCIGAAYVQEIVLTIDYPQRRH